MSQRKPREPSNNLRNNVQRDRVLRPLTRQRPRSSEDLFPKCLVRARDGKRRIVGTVLTFKQESQIRSEHQGTRLRDRLAPVPRDRADDHQVGW